MGKTVYERPGKKGHRQTIAARIAEILHHEGNRSECQQATCAEPWDPEGKGKSVGGPKVGDEG